MGKYDKSQYYIDFKDNEKLTSDEKIALERIQELYNPIERAEFLLEYKAQDKISEDDYSTLTGLPFSFD